MTLLAQSQYLKGKVMDKISNEPLGGVSITIYKKGSVAGSVSNKEGVFLVSLATEIDSLRFSMIGYEAVILSRTDLSSNGVIVPMNINPVELSEVVIKPMSALDIIRKAIQGSTALLPASNFENKFFYREIIKDSGNYFSVAEAIFRSQYFPSKKSYKLSLEKGRSKEDVSYTRLFEDYHPGGGPEALAEKNFNVGFPDFLDKEKIKWFQYKKDSILNFDGRTLYIISFDQKSDIHKALEKGRIYIDADDYSIIKYEAKNSPVGMPYIKDLSGTDKLFAELLHIDFKRKGWSKQVEFKKIDGKLFLSHVNAEYRIGYKQPKKNLDLDLTITSESVVTEPIVPFLKEIDKEEEWRRKNLVANLPTDFDADFWGSDNIISPTTQVDSIIATISKKNKEEPTNKIGNEWLYHHKDAFVVYQNHDSVNLIPIMKSSWQDDETGGMIYMEKQGDFTVEAAVSIKKRSDPQTMPDRGFQQAGIIIRDGHSKEENNIILCLGTGGNSVPKFFLRNTTAGKSKGTTDKIDSMNAWLRLEKKGATIMAYLKAFDSGEWTKINSYTLKWLNGPLQVGLMTMVRFAGNGPQMKPDMKVVFTHFNISMQ